MFEYDSRESARNQRHRIDARPAAQAGNASQYRATDTATVRTHQMGLVRESMKAGETFVGTRQDGWVWGQSDAGITGWVLRTSLKPVPGQKNRHENPAGAPHDVGRPQKGDYIGNGDRVKAEAQAKKDKAQGKRAGNKFTYSTGCKMRKAATVYRDAQLRRTYVKGDKPVTRKAEQTVYVRYVQGKAACIFLDGNWWFVPAGSVDLANLDERLEDARKG